MSVVETATLVLTGDSTGLEKAAATARRRIGVMARRVKALAKAAAAAWVAAAGTTVAAIGKAVAAAAQFEQQTAEIAKLVGERAADPIARSIRDLANITPVAQEELLNVAETAGRLGVRGRKNISRFTKVASEIGVATDMAANEAAEAMARIAAGTQTPTTRVRNLASVVNAMSNTLPRSFSEIANATMRAAPALSQIGAEAENIAALSGVLSSVSADARRAGTRLRRLAQELVAPGKVEDLADAFGMMTGKFQLMVDNDPTKVIIRMAEEMRAGSDAAATLRDTLGSASRQALAGLAQQLPTLRKRLGLANEQMREGTSIGREYEQFLNTLNSELTVLGNRIEAAFQKIGSIAMPVVKRIIREIQGDMPAIAAAVSNFLGTMLGQIADVISFVNGSVKEMGIGGLIGFLFMGFQGAAIGAVVGGLLDEMSAKFKATANNLFEGMGLDAPFELTPLQKARNRLNEIRSEMILNKNEMADLRETMNEAPRGSIPFVEAKADLVQLRKEQREYAGDLVAQRAMVEALEKQYAATADGIEGFTAKGVQALRRLANQLQGVDPEDFAFLRGEGVGQTETVGALDFRVPTVDLPAQEISSEIDRQIQRATARDITKVRLPVDVAVDPAGLPTLFPDAEQDLRRRFNQIAGQARTEVQKIRDRIDFVESLMGAGVVSPKRIREVKEKLRRNLQEAQEGPMSEFQETLKEGAKEAGRAVIEGIILGSGSLKDHLKRFFARIASKFIMAQLTGALQIGSPSRLTESIGRDIVRGIEVGMRRQMSSLAATTRKVARIPASVGGGPSGPRLAVSRATSADGRGGAAGGGGGAGAFAAALAEALGDEEVRMPTPEAQAGANYTQRKIRRALEIAAADGHDPGFGGRR